MMNAVRKLISRAQLAAFLAALTIISATYAVEAASPGSLDASFGIGGKVTTLAGPNGVNDVTTQADGKIVIVGSCTREGALDFCLHRYNSNGSIDRTFGIDGRVLTDFNNENDIAFGVAIQPDGKIVVAGTVFDAAGASTSAFARYLPNGSLDSTFDGDGKVIFDTPTTEEVLGGIAIQGDGRIVGVGLAGSDFLVIRLNVDGSADATFSRDGFVTTSVGGPSQALAVAIQPDGKIVAAGGVVAGSIEFALARYNSDGTLDAGFDGDGIATIDFSGGGDVALALAIQADGKIVPAGLTNTGGGEIFSALARLNPNGTLDTTFDGDGRVTTNVAPGNGINEVVQDIEIESDGKIVAAALGGGDFNVVRYNSNGGLDSGFGNGGIARTDFSGVDFVRASTLYGDKLVVVGDGIDGSDVRLVRYNLLSTPSASSDFDGDGFADATVFRPTQGTWFTLNSSNGTVSINQFGINGDLPVEGDFDGDGRADLAVFRPSEGGWFVQRSSNPTSFITVSFGQNGDRPVAGDYDKDGKTDIAVWRPSNGTYFVLRSGDNQTSFFAFPFGQAGDIPLGAAQ
jgi:uncharacterized delta-60 repeat protein